MVAAKKSLKVKTEETYGIYIKDGWQASKAPFAKAKL